MFLWSLLLLLWGPHAWAQRTAAPLSGRVHDAASGAPLAGATVSVKGAGKATQTDAEGEFRLDGVAGDAVLAVSFVGYTGLEVPVQERSRLDIALQPESALDEVVVVGYGTQQRKDLTGAIASVSAAQLEKQPAASMDLLLQGKAAGVQISQSSGAPGGRTSIRVRGASSVNAGNEPLLVIDGIPMYNNSKDPGGTSYGTFSASNALASVNPNDIQSIEVLKDASATAIYGSRGSNGVIIITTKRGRSGQAQVNYNGYYGWQQAANKLDLMNGAEHAAFLNDWAAASDLPEPFNNPASLGVGTDWQDLVFRQAGMTDHQLSVSGGTEQTKYFISGNYFKQDGIVINSGMERYAVRINVDQRLSERLNFTQSLTFNRTLNRSVPIANAGADNVRSAGERAYTASPTAALKDENGEYVVNWYGISKPESPVNSLLTTSNLLEGDNLLGNMALEYRIAEGLTAKTSWGVNLMNRANEEFYPAATTYIGGLFGGLGVVANRRITNVLNENVVTYSGSFGEKHRLEAVGGFTWQTEANKSSSTQPTGFPNDLLGINAIGGTTGTPAIESDLTDWSIASFLARVNYQFNNRLLVTATIRADGSSKFAEGSKWGYFPSMALGYRLREGLKLRASYGVTGNQEIGNYQSLARLVTNLLYIFDNQLVTGARQTSLANRALTWEKSHQWDVGADLAFWGNRLRLVVDYYKKDTRDLLFTINLPAYSGYSSALYNTGKLENRGVEVELGTDLLDRAFTWTVQGNYAYNRAKMVSLGRSGSTTLFVGHAPGVSLNYVYDGIFRNDEEVASQTAQTGVQPGDIRYRDTNNDGTFNADDRVITGSPQPKHIFGLNNQLGYKGFSLGIFLQGELGRKGNRIDRLFNPAEVASNKARQLLDRWSPANPDGSTPRAGVGNWLPSTYLLQDMSYIKLRNVQLAYQLPGRAIGGLGSVQVYVSGQNVLTFTRDGYFGYDPDGGNGYPTARTFLVGLNIGF